MEKKYREADHRDIGKEVQGTNHPMPGDSHWARATLKHIIEPDKDGRRFLLIVDGLWAAAAHARIEIESSYLELHQASGLMEGDWVRITRAAESREDGWNAFWTEDMNAFIGSIAQISKDKAEYGFKINGAGAWSYPCFVLEKVTSRPATEADVGQEVCWASEPEDRFWLLSVFHPKGDEHGRAVLQYIDERRAQKGFRFAFLESVHVPLDPPSAPAPEFLAIAPGDTYDGKNGPAPDPGQGFRLMHPGEKVIQGDSLYSIDDWMPSGNWSMMNGVQAPSLWYRRPLAK